ncbi:DNA replication factor C complex subunit Rfc1 [Oleoguttula sp. CCFEE 5521]
MPSDIRSFFGGKPAAAAPEPPKEKETKKRGRARKVVDDDDEDEPSPKKPAASKKKQAEPEPELEETTAGDFFGKDSKPKRSAATARPKTRGKPTADDAVPQVVVTRHGSAKGTPNGKGSARSKKTTSYVEINEDDFPEDDLEEDADDVFKVAAKTGKKLGDDYEEGTDEEDEKVLKPQKGTKAKAANGKVKDEDGDVKMKDEDLDADFVVPDDEDELLEIKSATKPAASPSKKRKSEALCDDEEGFAEVEREKKRATPVKKPVKAAATKAPAAKKQKKDEPKEESAAMKAIFDSIPTIEAPPPPDKTEGEDGKPKFQFGQHANSAMPAGAIDMSDLPQGEENCLAGLSFVFTGQLQQLGREQGQTLVKQYGGKIMSAPSKKTSYVVLGEDAGPKKLQVIKQHALKVINEQGLFELIKRLPANGGDSSAAEQHAAKIAKDEKKIRDDAAEIEREERAKAPAAKAKPTANGTSSSATSKGKAAADSPDSRLWTVRYAPTQLTQICGNKSQVDKLARWLRAFPKSQRTKFKLPGPDGSGTFRAVMIHGPPGIGKTTAAHLVAKLEGYDIVETNASDTRSKKLIESGMKSILSTTSLNGYFAHDPSEVDAGKKKIVLIMDEVDGLSAGDRGGVGAIAAMAKKSQIPIILICNERKQPKMKPFDFVTYDLGFRRPTTDMIRSRISTIAFREGMKLPPNVVNALIEGTGADIRQVINMISTAKLDSANLSFEDGKDMSKAWEKHIILKPWDMVGKILGGGLFNAANKSSLNDKQELYFNDHEFAPLMLQENYLHTQPQRANRFSGDAKRHKLAILDLSSRAADAISDGDLIDRMIHGSQQQWSLMPAHAMASFVRPASFVYGSMAGHRTAFTAWLGKNSNQSKLMRMVKEIQGHMRLRCSGDRYEVRQSYVPILFERLVKRLERDGKEAVPEIIELMDEYFLTRDDWDAVLELGVGQADAETVKIESQAKATFTRLYNAQSHPLPFLKASQIAAPLKPSAKDKPDLEEAIEASEDEALEEVEPKDDEDGDVDLSKDKYVKVPKKKKVTATKGKGKSKKAADDDGEDEDEDEEVKGKGKAKAKAKAKAPAKGKGKK